MKKLLNRIKGLPLKLKNGFVGLDSHTKQAVYIALLAVCAIAFCVALYFIITYAVENKQAAGVYDGYIREVSAGETGETVKVGEDTVPVIDFAAENIESSDTVSWIVMNDSVINYPIVKGEDNDYYLNHLPDGTKNKNGSIFMDYRSSADFSDRNTFIYGHHMRSGAMFATLVNYGKQSYYEEHPYFYIITPNEIYRCEVFSAYVVPDSSDVFTLTYSGDADFASYLQKVEGLSEIYTGISPAANDRIVTLVTCTYEYDNARFVVHARLVPTSEEEE